MRRHAVQLLHFFLRQTEPIIKVAHPGLFSNLMQTLDILLAHELTTHVCLGHLVELCLQTLPGLGQFGGQFRLISPFGKALPITDLRISPQHLEARADLVNAVVDGFQLGGLVDYVFRAGDLAAVVHPGRNAEGIALLVIHRELGKCAGLRVQGTVEQHLGQLRYTIAVPAGVGRLGVNGRGQQANDRLHQHLLILKQLAGFDSNGQGAREAVQKLPQAGHRLGWQKRRNLHRQDPQKIFLAITQCQRQVTVVTIKPRCQHPGRLAAQLFIQRHRLRVMLGINAAGEPQFTTALVTQKHRATTAFGHVDQVLQHHVQHAVQPRLSTQRQRYLLKVIDSASHATDDHAQVVDLTNPGAHTDLL